MDTDLDRRYLPLSIVCCTDGDIPSPLGGWDVVKRLFIFFVINETTGAETSKQKCSGSLAVRRSEPRFLPCFLTFHTYEGMLTFVSFEHCYV